MGIAISDADLLAASRRGEHAAFGALVERYQGVVCAVTYSRTGDQALSEDVAQETFLAAWRQLDQLREPNRLRSWLCGIAKNLAAKARKRTRRETPAPDDVDSELVAEGDPFEALSTAQSERLVGDALARVPEKYRDVLVLYYREQRPIAEIARLLDISEAAALQRLARGRQYLADGVASLVERSLRALPRRSLVASVVAALPLIASPRVEAHPTSGGSMFAKLGLAAALLAAAGGAAIVVAKRDTSPARPSTTAPVQAAATPAALPASAKAAVRAPTMPALPAKLAAASAPTLAAAPVIPSETIARLHIAEGPSRGPADAPVVVAVYTDMQCSFCANALGSIDQLLDEYPTSLRIVVKQLPVHETAKLAAEAAFAADAQGKFWELHDLMLQNQDDLSRDALIALGQQAGLDTAQLATALDTHAYAGALRADVEGAQEIEVTGTPTFVVNGRKVVGLLPVAELRSAIDAALAAN